ncbi:MAG: hypothetical protein QGH73_00715 [Rhodospirillales bacterium]|jgi:hypothetical protein|nr:hypothetical protein [Rhodospirillales bacterium]MDP6642666.1 hypothetical protein [Rhodospirillales bacterium]MDP6840179.1 hypothetical protein [Rhodospirillales bacterium]|tara:strand:+ start:146 stop:1033 length:888 start_codon:yes stop_codon:yes gene_type:complete
MADMVKLPAKLPVWGTMTHTYRFFWAERRQFWLLALPAIAVVSLLSALADWSVITANSGRIDALSQRSRLQELPLSAIILTLVATVAGIWAYVCYSVAWHRSYLVPGEQVTIGSCYLWRARQGRFLWTLIKVALITALAWIPASIVFVIVAGFGAWSAGGGGFSAQGPGVLMAMALIGLLIAVVYARLAVLLPAAAVDDVMTIGRVWALTRGNGWRLLGIVILVSIPIGIVLVPVSIFFGLASMTTPDYGPLTTSLVQHLLVQFLSYIYIAVGISALSVCYARLAAVGGELEATQ